MKNKTLISVVVIILIVGIGAVIYFYWWVPRQEESKKELSDVLNVYNYDEYFSETTLEDFEKEYGVDVTLELYDDEEIMVGQVQANPAKYDIVVGSDGVIRDMIGMRLLARLNLENIPNLKNIGEEFQNPAYDPGNSYSIPYMWGTTGIAVNRKHVTETEDSWSILWNPKYKGKMAMLNNSFEVIGAALKYLGYSGSSTNLGELEEARKLLLEQKPLLRGYEECVSMRDEMIAENLWVTHQYSGEGAFAADENENVEYIIPEEGSFLWIDNLAIPKDSPHKYTAEVFLNFILRAEVSADIANYLWYANTNEAAREFTDQEILDEPSIYPSEEVLARCELFEDLGEAESKYNEIWAELQ